MAYFNIEELENKVFVEVYGTEGGAGITFVQADGTTYKMIHEQDCCESVYVDDINGELEWLVDTPILEATESVNGDGNEEDIKALNNINEEDYYMDESYTWTFYHFRTAKGYVTIRWFGESNGWYSECVDLIKYESLS